MSTEAGVPDDCSVPKATSPSTAAQEQNKQKNVSNPPTASSLLLKLARTSTKPLVRQVRLLQHWLLQFLLDILVFYRCRCIASSVQTRAKREVSQISTSGKTIASLPTLISRLSRHQLSQRQRVKRLSGREPPLQQHLLWLLCQH